MNERGSIIAELRKEAGYTQRSLAEALNITDKAVSKWERGLCMPDSTLLPRLSLLLNADIELLVSSNAPFAPERWIGVIDLPDENVHFDRIVYDKPLIHYILSHYLLLGITELFIRCSEENRRFLSQPRYKVLGFSFTFGLDGLPCTNAMIIHQPFLLFGSDLTRLLRRHMTSLSTVRLVPVNREPVFLLCTAEYLFMYQRNPDYLFHSAADKTLGRGMIVVKMDTPDGLNDAASFVRLYQHSSGLQMGNLEEIARDRGLINEKIYHELCR